MPATNTFPEKNHSEDYPQLVQLPPVSVWVWVCAAWGLVIRAFYDNANRGYFASCALSGMYRSIFLLLIAQA